MPRTYTFFCLILSVLFASCGLREADSHTVYTVVQGDFEDVVTVEGVVEPLRSTMLACPQRIDGIVQWIVDDGTPVEAGDTVCVLEDQNLQNRYDELTIYLENAEANYAKVKADLAMQYALLEAQVRSNEAQTQIAYLDSLQLKYATPNQRRVKELELRKAEIEKAKLVKKLDALKVIQQSEVRKLELELQRNRNELASTREMLDKLVICSPVKGLATLATSWMTGEKVAVGDNVWSNMPLVSIPEMDRMKVKMLTPERDFKVIDVGDTVMYAFDAMPGNVAFGTIVNKMPVGQPASQGSKVKVFDVEASIDSVAVMPDPGFTARCRVVLRRERGVLTVPQVAVFEEDSVRVVYVRNGRGYERREVHTGTSSLREVVVTEGLRPGDVVSLTSPRR